MAHSLDIAMFCIHSCPLGQLGTRDTGGMNVYVREVSRHLGQMGHHVDIYTRAHDPYDAQVNSPFENVRVIHIQAGPMEDMGKMAQYSYLPDFALNMETFCMRYGANYDLVQSHYWLSGLMGQKYAFQWSVPHVVMFHTLGAIKNNLPLGEAESAVRLAAEYDLMHGAQRIISATALEKEELGRLYDADMRKISVIPCGVNTALFQPQDKSAARNALGLGAGKIILFVGRIEALKGIENLIYALSLLHYDARAKLFVVGGDEYSRPDVARLETLARELGVDAEFSGSVAHGLLPTYYSAADVSVVASYYESFCLVVLEALACRTPVVSTRVGVAPAVIRNGYNGFLVDDNSPQSLAVGLEAALCGGLKDADEIRRSVLDYSWEQTACRVEAEYRGILLKGG
ncbi:MAG: glycosyltransferase [Dehalococcoidia bacterium]|nr:glycosyltransferase [Dehalococcoidia bacterium]